MKKLLLLLGCWTFLASDAFALDPAKTLFQYNCQSWTHQDGLPVNRINSITQTREGCLWLGTQKGLVRFDGLRFKQITLPTRSEFPNQTVSCLASATDGGLWFGVASGSFGFYDGRNFIPSSAQLEMDPALSVITLCETAHSALWIGSEKGAARIIDGHINATLSFDQIGNCSSVYESRSGRVWIGTVQRGLYYWQDERLNSFPDESLKKSIIFAITEDNQGRLWVGTEFGPRCYDTNFQFNSIPEMFNEVRALLVDRRGMLWMGTRGSGVARFENGAFMYLRKTDGLASDSITSLYEDREGSIWVGTKEGLSQISDLKFPTFSASEGLLQGSCHGVALANDGGIWATFDRGVSWFNGKGATNFSTEVGLAVPYVKRAFQTSNGDLYLIDGGKNIEILSGGKVISTLVNNDLPVAIVETSEGIINSVGGNLFRLSTNGLAPYQFKADENPSMYWIYNLSAASDGGFWVGSANGIFHVSKGSWKRWGLDEGLASSRVNSVLEDQDQVVWIGLTSGIGRLKDGKLKCFNRDDGLFDNYIYAIVPDDLGQLWVQSSRGIFRVSKKALEDFAAGKIAKIACSGYDGLESVKTIDTTEIESTGCKTPDGRIWFPTPLGLVMIDPARVPINSVPPPVYFERIRVNGLEITGLTNATFQPGAGDIEIDYAAASFITPQNLKFKYHLEGFDPAWVDADTRRSAFYANLKPGKYRFRVQACNSDGVWNEDGSGFQLELLPHFYETAWFKFLATVAAIAALVAVYTLFARRIKTSRRKLEAENELLESRVRERTANLETLHKQLVDASREAGKAEVATSVLHNVGNVLNSVNVTTSLLKQRIGDSKLASLAKLAALLRQNQSDLPHFLNEDQRGRQFIPYLETLSKHSAEEQSECLVELDSLSRNIEHIKNIVATQQSYARISGVSETIQLSDLVEDAVSMHTAAYERHSVTVIREFADIPPVTVDRHKLLQILINLLHNAKYACEVARASDRQIIIRITPSGPDHVKVQVADNGVGIAPENLTRIFSHGFTTRKNGHGFGLHSGALAARDMGGSLKAHSDGIGKGATFTLELPLHGKSAHLKSAKPTPGLDLAIAARQPQ